MPASLSLNKAGTAEGRPVTVTGSGFAANTSFTVTIKAANQTQLVKVTSDGSGGFSFPLVTFGPFDHSIDVRSSDEHNGKTSATASVTLKCGN